jgi:signal transduction histidine kinase
MSSENLQELENAYERLMAISLNQVPADGLKDLVDPEVMGYGTTIDEQIFDIEGYITLIRNQEEQAKAAGMDFRFEREKIHYRLSPKEDVALFVEQIEATVGSDEILHQFNFRLSMMMEKQNGAWKLVHWHGSLPSDTENDTWHINEWKAEKEKLEQLVEERTRELKETQDQLIQREKLASLGQLTAGIAHEIKNPLNFVTNFSDLSVELLEEVRHEIRDMRREMGGETSNVKGERSLHQSAESGVEEQNSGVSGGGHDPDLILEILDDIEVNLRKIHEHGSRADRIVKSMLQHSRGTEGVKEPTDINQLLEEYVTLSFHGMRASDNPINVDLDFQLDESIKEIPLITEDFTRVIVNLCNNAFDAMREKQGSGHKGQGGHKEQAAGDYLPKLLVRTHQGENTVTIEIEDNGPGIPEEMRDKILEPFFTTKKGTQGTGLGLSITYDIVKAHGGSMEIESEPGKTVFKIDLKR